MKQSFMYQITTFIHAVEKNYCAACARDQKVYLGSSVASQDRSLKYETVSSLAANNTYTHFL